MVQRALFVVAGGVAVFASYLIAIADPGSWTAGTLGVVLPGAVSAAVLITYAVWESRNERSIQGKAQELSAQLVRKEIEIGRLATVDELTGLYTRREFEDFLRLEIERARRHGREASLLLIEIDDIVELGEQVGSISKGYLLSEVSGILRSQLRTNDLGCRFSNDTLALLLPETGREQALVVAGKLRAAVDKHEFLGHLDGSTVRLTVSQGIATGRHARDEHEWTRAAENALCDARAGGFDQVRVYELPPPADEPPLAKAS
jgi:diguanylate cyclase (GGDEF)-like protein